MSALSAYTSELRKQFSELLISQAAFAARDDVPWERTRVNRFLSGKDNTIAPKSFIECVADVGARLGKPVAEDRRDHLLSLRRAALRERATAVGLLEVIDEEFHLIRVQMSNSREEVEVYRHIKDSLLGEVRYFQGLLADMQARNAEQELALQAARFYLKTVEDELRLAEHQREALLTVIVQLQEQLQEVRRSAQAWDSLSVHAGWFAPLLTGVLLSSFSVSGLGLTWPTAGLGFAAFAISGGLGSPVTHSTGHAVTHEVNRGSLMGPYSSGSYYGTSTTSSVTHSTGVDIVAIFGWALLVFCAVMLTFNRLWVWPAVVAYVVFEVLRRAPLGPPQARYVIRTLAGIVPGCLLLVAAVQLGTGGDSIFNADHTAWMAAGAYAALYLLYALIRLAIARTRLRRPEGTQVARTR
jgi:hypothetical protein